MFCFFERFYFEFFFSLFPNQVYLLFGFYDRFYDLGMLKDGLFFCGLGGGGWFNISKQRLLMIVTPVQGFGVCMLNLLAWLILIGLI